MLEHNEIVEKEHLGDIDINQIEKDVNDKQKDEIYELDGKRADLPNLYDGTDGVDAALKKAKKKQKMEYMKKKMEISLRRFYQTL